MQKWFIIKKNKIRDHPLKSNHPCSKIQFTMDNQDDGFIKCKVVKNPIS